MSSITTRAGKGAALTNAEVDANFTNLNTDKAEKSITISAGAGLTGGGDLSGNRTLALDNSGVSAAAYGGNNSIPSLTIDAYGRVTAAGTVTPSGTWGISISGNAATATTSTSLSGGTVSGTTGTFSSGLTVTPGIITLGTSTINGVADANWGILYRPSKAGVVAAHGFLDASGNSAAYITNAGNIWAAGSVTAASLAGGASTGSGASGTWGISITGNAATVTNGVYQNQYGSFQTVFASNINANTNRNAGVYGSYASAATNTPTTSGLLWNATAGTDGSGDGAQIWQDYVTNNLYARQRWGGSWGSWLTILSASNYTNYVNTYFGSASTSGTTNWNDVSNTKPGTSPTLLLGTATNGPGGGTYYHPLNFEYSSKNGTGNVTQLAVGYGQANDLLVRGRYDGAWSSWSRFLHSGNYNSYSPTLTGGGASGTWGISITGNAATATNSQGVTFTTQPNASWGGRLQLGGNGGGSGVALIAKLQATDGNLHMDNGSGKAMYLGYYHPGTIYLNGGTYSISSNGSFYNGTAASISSQANSATITAATAATANTIVLREGSGHITGNYIFGSYFNSTAGNSENPSIGQFWTQSTGDNYLRKSTPAHVVNQLQAVSSLGYSYYQVNTWLQINGTYGLYFPNAYGGHFHPNDLSSYTQFALRGSKNGYGGFYDLHSTVNGVMFDGSGNGGSYREASGRWYYYYSLGSDCMGIGTSAVDSAYSLYLNKGVRGNSTNYTTGATYSSIYYDYNDASYYCDPANASRFFSLTVGVGNAYSDIYMRDDEATSGQVRIHANSNIVGFLRGDGGAWFLYAGPGGAYATAFNNVSDYRLKNIVRPFSGDALNIIDALEEFEYTFIDSGKSDIGYLAHQVQGVYPTVVNGQKDAVKKDGSIDPQSVDYGKMVPLLSSGIKQLLRKIEALELEVVALKGS